VTTSSLPEGVKLKSVSVKQLELLEKNARFMTSETFKRLVENVKRDGGLTSVPFCWRTPEKKYRVLSGNHRVMAGMEAGFEEIVVMYTDKDLSHKEQVAIQLSHNAISGEDDEAILAELYQEIGDVDLKAYSGLDDATLKQMSEVKIIPLSEASLEFRTVAFMFLPEEADNMKELFEESLKLAAAKDVYLARFADYDRLLDSLTQLGGAHNVSNSATAMTIMLNMFERALPHLSKVWFDGEHARHKGWIPIETMFGNGMPAESAAKVAKAVAKVVGREELKPSETWKALERMAEKYLDA